MNVDDPKFFEVLADELNAHHERVERFGEADFVAAIVMGRELGPFCVQLVFEGLSCIGVDEVDPDEARVADFRLEGPIDAWQAMFDDVLANGRATGLQTINSLALLGDRIVLAGTDPMGLDKFSRFNQNLQEFFDGAAHLAPVAT